MSHFFLKQRIHFCEGKQQFPMKNAILLHCTMHVCLNRFLNRKFNSGVILDDSDQKTDSLAVCKIQSWMCIVDKYINGNVKCVYVNINAKRARYRSIQTTLKTKPENLASVLDSKSSSTIIAYEIIKLSKDCFIYFIVFRVSFLVRSVSL